MFIKVKKGSEWVDFCEYVKMNGIDTLVGVMVSIFEGVISDIVTTLCFEGVLEGVTISSGRWDFVSLQKMVQKVLRNDAIKYFLGLWLSVPR